LPTATVAPTPTPATPLTILLMPADLPAEYYARYQDEIYTRAQQAGMRFQVRNTLSVAEAQAEPGLKILVAVEPDASITEIAAALPGLRILAIGGQDIQPAANLFTLGSTERMDIAGFMGGYITALLVDDYRVGALIPKDDESGTLALDAFRNGMTYYCGLCNPTIPPWYSYPVYAEIPADTRPNQYGAYALSLLDYQVGAVFVHPAVLNDDLLNTLYEYNIPVVSTVSPPDDYRSIWIASIQPDVFGAIDEAWNLLTGDAPGYALPSPLNLTDVNEAWLPESRLRLVRETFEGLRNGQISPLYETENTP
jgi:hypothetical protein